MSSTAPPSAETLPPPSSILILGAGAFGLSTALALIASPRYKATSITILDTFASETSSFSHDNPSSSTPQPNPHGSSIDTSRIIRADYADPAYYQLATSALQRWRRGFGGQGCYRESGMIVVGKEGGRGWDYVQRSCKNVSSGSNAAGVKVLENPEAIKDALGTEGTYGSAGYLNPSCGWADSEAAIRWTIKELERSGRVTFVRGTAKSLIFSNDQETTEEEDDHKDEGVSKEANHRHHARHSMFEIPFRGTRRSMFEFAFRSHKRRRSRRSSSASSSASRSRLSDSPSGDSKRAKVLGARLTEAPPLYADLTILALGAWSPSLIDLRGRIQATGQILGYIPITPAECLKFKDMPVLFDLQGGMAVFPPNSAHGPGTTRGNQQHVKLLRHGYGYKNPTPSPFQAHASPSFFASQTTQAQNALISLPSPPPHVPIPIEGLSAFHAFLSSVTPTLSPPSTRLQPSTSRICWYADTPTGDFLIDYHPSFSGTLFITAGGSGHGFKFLPVLGEKAVEVLEGRGDEGLKGRWRWRDDGEVSLLGDDWWTEDGSRGGVKGMVLERERRKWGSRL